MFCGDRIVLTLHGGIFFNAEALLLKFSAHNCMVLQNGTFTKYLPPFNTVSAAPWLVEPTAVASVNLAIGMVPAVSSSGVANITYLLFFLILVCEAIGTEATPGLWCKPRVIVKMIVEKQMECRLAGETEVLGETLPPRHFCPSQNPT
jgi:hypothetical protein